MKSNIVLLFVDERCLLHERMAAMAERATALKRGYCWLFGHRFGGMFYTMPSNGRQYLRCQRCGFQRYCMWPH